MKKQTVVLGITGGIAAVKVPSLIKELLKQDIRVIAIMTESAAKIISISEVEKITGEKVYTTLFPESYSTTDVLSSRHVEHIDIADAADLFVIVPATANVIGKLASGVADDFLTTAVLATQARVLICPSMNVHMWQHPVVQKNLNECRSLGYHFLAPESGALACGYEGQGRLPEVMTITNEITQLLNKKNTLKNKNVLITSGGTIEPIDDVRFITNKSSGKMGAAIADACYMAGAHVLLLKAEQASLPRYSVTTDTFETVEDLEKKLEKFLPTFDICFHVAAVSDFTVKKMEGKITSENSHQLALNPREKIYKKIKQIHPNITLITFKAESNFSVEEWDKELQKVLSNSTVDAVIGNDIGKAGQGFQSDMNAAIVLTKTGSKKEFSLTTKKNLAEEIIEFLFTTNDQLSNRHSREGGNLSSVKE